MSEALKRELTSVSNWLGLLIGAIGNVLPYLTPDTLAALGFTPAWVHRISTGVMLLLIAYRGKPKSDVLPPPVAEANHVPFVPPAQPASTQPKEIIK